jgi:hypothetical protein
MRISAWRIEMLNANRNRSAFAGAFPPPLRERVREGGGSVVRAKHKPLVPAKAGTQSRDRQCIWLWIPAFAGMSGEVAA